MNPDRQRRQTHALRKADEARKRAALRVDGKGKHRVAISRARAEMGK